MKRQRAKPPKHGANVRIPESMTTEFVERVMNLRSSVKTDYLKQSILSKFVSSETDPSDVRRQRAINKWLATERNNEATNDRIRITHAEYNLLPRVGFKTFVDRARKLVASIIGDVPTIGSLIGSFSGGASTSRARTASFPAGKYLGKAHATYPAQVIFENLISEEMPMWAGFWFNGDLAIEAVPGNVLFTVPKKTDIDRCACKEPDINMFLQKGVGNHFRSSLKSVGIDLNDQSKNRRLARIGSIDGSLATLDLSSASDSVAREFVKLLLPELWFELLDALRCPVTIIDGEEHPNEMFSSMGNGFTFELESLLFYVLARTTAYCRGIPGVISVYGDDLIVPTPLSTDLIWVLGYFGFETNVDKSFTEGPFRESCGGHYYDGYDITPFYLKAPLVRLDDLMHVANSLRKWAIIPGLSVLDPEVEEIWLWLKGYVPPEFWGGRDYNFKYRLVTPDAARYYLAVTAKEFQTGTGGYIHWLNTTWNRAHPGEVESSTRSVESTVYRRRKVRDETVTSLRELFLSELKVAE